MTTKPTTQKTTRAGKRTYQVVQNITRKVPIVLGADVRRQLLRIVHVGEERDDHVVRPPTQKQGHDDVREGEDLAGAGDAFLADDGGVTKKRGVVVAPLHNPREDPVGQEIHHDGVLVLSAVLGGAFKQQEKLDDGAHTRGVCQFPYRTEFSAIQIGTVEQDGEGQCQHEVREVEEGVARGDRVGHTERVENPRVVGVIGRTAPVVVVAQG